MGISLQNVPVLPGAAVDEIELREKNEEKEEKNAENVNVYKKGWQAAGKKRRARQEAGTQGRHLKSRPGGHGPRGAPGGCLAGGQKTEGEAAFF